MGYFSNIQKYMILTMNFDLLLKIDKNSDTLIIVANTFEIHVPLKSGFTHDQ